MKIVSLDQDGSAWHAWRNAGLGSSDAAAILDCSPWKKPRELWEEKTMLYHAQLAPGKDAKPPKHVSDEAARAIRERMSFQDKKNGSAKTRGKIFEPRVRAMYEQWTGKTFPPVCGQHDELDWMKVSLDGDDEQCDLFIEIKCPKRENHELALAGGIPEYYEPQVWHQFAVSGRSNCHYISYHPQFPQHSRLAIVEVKYEDVRESVESLVELEKIFWRGVVGGYYPLAVTA